MGSKRKNPRDSEDLRALQTSLRWKRITGDRGQRSYGTYATPTWMLCSWGNPLCPSLACVIVSARMCLSVFVCECVYLIPQDCGLGALCCVREAEAIARPIPRAEYLHFFLKFIKASSMPLTHGRHNKLSQLSAGSRQSDRSPAREARELEALLMSVMIT